MSALTRIERARGFLQAARLSDDWLTGMQQRALVLEAHYSTHNRGHSPHDPDDFSTWRQGRSKCGTLVAQAQNMSWWSTLVLAVFAVMVGVFCGITCEQRQVTSLVVELLELQK